VAALTTSLSALFARNFLSAGDLHVQFRNSAPFCPAIVKAKLLPELQTQSYFSKEFTMNLIVTQRMTPLAALVAATLMAGCGLRSTNPSSETLTVYEDAPTLTHLDLVPPGNSPGDVYHFFAPLRSSPGGPVTGEVFGTKTLTKVATDTNPSSEKRATLLFFTFGEGQPNYRFGRPRYSPTAAEFDAGKTVVRAILGGTGSTWARAAN
jgi:hypothetical protein